MSTLGCRFATSVGPESIAALMQQWLADDTQCENGHIETHVVRRTEVTHEEVLVAARLWWEQHGAVAGQNREVQDREYRAARQRLLQEPLGFVRIIVGRYFIGVPTIWAAPCGDPALRKQVIRSLLQCPIEMMRCRNRFGTVIRAVVMPWCSKEVATVMNTTKGWCCFSVEEGGKISFFQHDHA